MQNVHVEVNENVGGVWGLGVLKRAEHSCSSAQVHLHMALL